MPGCSASPAVREAIAARLPRRTGAALHRRQRRRRAGRAGRALLRAAMPRRAGRRGDRARADLCHLRGGDRRQRRDDGDRAAARPSAVSTPISTRWPPRSRRARGSIWINSPHNPTGAVFTADEIAAIAELCRRHDLWLLSDEVYEDLAFARPHVSAWSLPGMAERTVVVSSLSKSHAIAGVPLRLDHRPAGAGAAPVQPAAVHDLRQPRLYPGRRAGRAASSDLPRSRRCARITGGARRCCRALLAEAPHLPRRCRPKAACSCCSTAAAPGSARQDFALDCWNSEHVAVLPCDGFGPSAAGHLRIALCAPDARLAEAGPAASCGSRRDWRSGRFNAGPAGRAEAKTVAALPLQLGSSPI